MAEIIVPTWVDFQEVVSSANERLTICSPYYTEAGVEKVLDNLMAHTSLIVLTGLSPSTG